LLSAKTSEGKANAIHNIDHVDWLLVEEYQVIIVVLIETKNEPVNKK
jgi:hypothetical protein